MEKYEGLIVRATGGFYYVAHDGGVAACRARGVFRRQGVTPLVGDRALVEPEGDGGGTVDEILPRRNSLERPPVANVDRLVIVASTQNPPPDLLTVDKLTAVCWRMSIEPVVVFSKCDLGDAAPLRDRYQSAGYRSFAVSSATGEGVGALAGALGSGISVFTGNSGVGKSSLLNRIAPQLDLTVGEVSHKLGRGRQTTRTVELFNLGGGQSPDAPGRYLADTPGFSSLDLVRPGLLHKEQLEEAFREFTPFLGRCRFTGCCHIREESCAVIDAVERGEISRQRYESYCLLYESLKSIPEWEYRKKPET